MSPAGKLYLINGIHGALTVVQIIFYVKIYKLYRDWKASSEKAGEDAR